MHGVTWHGVICVAWHGVAWCGMVCHRVPGQEGFLYSYVKNRNQAHTPWAPAGRYLNSHTIREGQGQSPSNVTFKCAVCVLQKHGLRLHLRNPYSFTPMLEEGTGGKVPRSLLLGTDMAENQKQIAQFSRKDAQVGKVTSD